MTTPAYFGDTLTNPGLRQPTGGLTIDAYGLAQAQLTFALDTYNTSNIIDAIETYKPGIPYPDNLGFEMTSYKYHFTYEKGNIAMLVVDYMGIANSNGYTDAQITGVANTQAQPIETHPNFTKITVSGISTNILAGTPTGTKYNNASFSPLPNPNGGTQQYSFSGFGISTNPDQPNPKAGVRQYLRPMLNIRGQIFFNHENLTKAYAMGNAVGWLVNSDSDLQKLVAPIVPPSGAYKKALITSVNLEAIGNPSSTPAIKVTYDLLIANDSLGWDTDIYGIWASSFFS